MESQYHHLFSFFIKGGSIEVLCNGLLSHTFLVMPGGDYLFGCYHFLSINCSNLLFFQGDFLVHFMDIAREELMKQLDEITVEKLQVSSTLLLPYQEHNISMFLIS